MSTYTHGRTLGMVAATAGVATLAIGGATAPAHTGSASAAKKITAAGVGGVKVGKTFKELHDKGLIGPLRKGCELGGPNTRSAKLKTPLKGNVNFTLKAPRKVTDITVRGGAKARGVGIGATIPQIKAAFPKAKVDHSTDSVFAVTLVKIPKAGGGRITFAVGVKSKKVTLIGVPIIAFCE
jgi:hypothetical protein